MGGGRLGERLFGLFLLGVGLFAIYRSSLLPAGTVRTPDAGLFPFWISIALTVLVACSLAVRAPGALVPAERLGVARAAVMMAAIGFYAILLPWLGFLLCTVALLALTLRGLGRVGWLWTTVWAFGGTVGCYLLFTRLGLPLPAGVLGF